MILDWKKQRVSPLRWLVLICFNVGISFGLWLAGWLSESELPLARLTALISAVLLLIAMVVGSVLITFGSRTP